jgi:hypothetical protein
MTFVGRLGVFQPCGMALAWCAAHGLWTSNVRAGNRAVYRTSLTCLCNRDGATSADKCGQLLGGGKRQIGDSPGFRGERAGDFLFLNAGQEMGTAGPIGFLLGPIML